MEATVQETYTADDMIEAFSVPEDTFDITLPNGKVVKAKSVRDIDQMTQVRKKAAAILKAVDAGTLPAVWKPYLPISAETATVIAQFSRMLVRRNHTHI